LDANGSIYAFAIAYNGWPFYIAQANGWSGWTYLGGAINAAPGVAMNFDGRLEIFGIGTDGNVYHNWQLSAAGAWSGWAGLGMPSNSGATNGTDVPYFLTNAQNSSNYASAKTSCYSPPWWTAANAWRCGSRVNITFTGYNKKSMHAFDIAKKLWNGGLYSQYSAYGVVPVQLYISFGGPQSAHVYPVSDNSISGSDPNSFGRAQNTNQKAAGGGRLIGLDIQIIKGMTYPQTLTNVFAHELGHTFGLFDCVRCATKSGGGPTVMDTAEYPPNGHGWDYVGKNFTEGLPGPTACDLGVIDSHLSDYRACA
jgi:hypothetical protein